MKIEEPDLAGSYTYADYMTWRWDQMVELIDGKIYKMSPAPTSTHQKISGKLFLIIGNYLMGNRCQLFSAPFDVRLPFSSNKKKDNEIITVVQPDLCVICDPTKIDERGCLGAPDWIIEILSRYTSAKDLREKFKVYEETGVREYWVVHPTEQTVLIYVLEANGKYQGILKPCVRTDKIVPVTLPGLTIDLGFVFPEED
ncbi:MAG: Uma2 family endonuclease [Cyclobacteriaceae bacterium]|nr:Uma2 family endonuclease [Cyclobacteriaceae bacterium]